MSSPWLSGARWETCRGRKNKIRSREMMPTQTLYLKHSRIINVTYFYWGQFFRLRHGSHKTDPHKVTWSSTTTMFHDCLCFLMDPPCEPALTTTTSAGSVQRQEHDDLFCFPLCKKRLSLFSVFQHEAVLTLAPALLALATDDWPGPKTLLWMYNEWLMLQQVGWSTRWGGRAGT